MNVILHAVTVEPHENELSKELLSDPIHGNRLNLILDEEELKFLTSLVD